jgi:hypothetical protein
MVGQMVSFDFGFGYCWWTDQTGQDPWYLYALDQGEQVVNPESG